MLLLSLHLVIGVSPSFAQASGNSGATGASEQTGDTSAPVPVTDLNRLIDNSDLVIRGTVSQVVGLAANSTNGPSTLETISVAEVIRQTSGPSVQVGNAITRFVATPSTGPAAGVSWTGPQDPLVSVGQEAVFFLQSRNFVGIGGASQSGWQAATIKLPPVVGRPTRGLSAISKIDYGAPAGVMASDTQGTYVIDSDASVYQWLNGPFVPGVVYFRQIDINAAASNGLLWADFLTRVRAAVLVRP